MKRLLRSVHGLRRIAKVLIVALVSLVMTITTPFIIDGVSNISISKGLTILFWTFGLAPAFVVFAVLGAMWAPLSGNLPWRTRVLLVGIGYCAMIAAYAGAYFEIASIGDYNQAASTSVYFEYVAAQKNVSKLTREELLQELPDGRPIKGIQSHVFLAIHEDAAGDYERRYLSPQRLVEMARDNRTSKPRLAKDAVVGLLVESLHYSIVTAATVGYGDIVPSSLLSKLVTDSQILASVAIVIFSLGFVMSSRPAERQSD